MFPACVQVLRFDLQSCEGVRNSALVCEVLALGIHERAHTHGNRRALYEHVHQRGLHLVSYDR